MHDHIDGCESCREFMAAMARFEVGATAMPNRLAAGDEVGRYTIISKLGVGAMGVVYEADDRVLHRKVALKFLSRSAAGRSEQARIFSEARAMARLSHPNVAQVYEATAVDGRVFIAMELVRGQPLTLWLDTTVHVGWKVLVDVFAQAALGLAAAHAAGVVHGDFKPENVLLSQGRVPKIVDFGLAGLVEIRRDGEPDEEDSAGEISGTPLYLSPEVWNGRSADASSDQFALCVTLFRALFGRQPFPGTTIETLRSSVVSGSIEPPSSTAPGPARLHRVLLRGLRSDPAQRWPSMDALADALIGCRKAHARRPLWFTGVAIAAVSGTVGALGASNNPDPCPSPSTLAAEVWSDARRSDIVANLQPTSGRDGDVAVAGLDAYAQRWAAGRSEACERMRLGSPETSSASVDAALPCLADARRALDAAATVLQTVPAANLTDAVGVLQTLPDLDWCVTTGAQTLPEAPEVPDERSAKVPEALAHLAEAKALRSAGLLDESSAAIQAAAETLADLGEDQPAWDEVRLSRGRTRFETGEYALALEDLLHAFRAATRTGRDRLAIESSRALAFVLSNTAPDRLDEARAYTRISHDLASGRGDVVGASAAESQLSQIEIAAGDYAQALVHADSALALQETRDLTDPLLTASLLIVRGVALGNMGRLPEAEATYRRALSLDLGLLGPEHPRVANARMGLAAALGAQGNFEDALVELRAARTIFAQRYAPDHRMTVDAAHNVGVALLGLRRFSEAEQEFTALLALPSLPGSAADRLRVQRNLGATLVGQGLYTEAARSIRSAVEASELADDHPDVLACREVIGGALGAAGEWKEAAAVYGALVEHFLRTTAADHPSVLRIRVEHQTTLWRSGASRPEAVDAELRTLRIAATSQLGAGHGVSLRTALVLAKLAEAQGRADDAQTLHREAIDAADTTSALHKESVVAYAGFLLRAERYADVVDELSEARLSDIRGGTRSQALEFLGYARWELAEDRVAARALVEQAAERYAARPGIFPDRAERARSWLAEHRL